MRLAMFGATDVGKVRKNNQDRYYCDHRQGIAIVCDGIGGRKGGDIAAQLTVDGLKKAFLESEFLASTDVAPFLYGAIDRVNSRVIKEGTDFPKYQGMGTTVNFLLFEDRKVSIAHVGDSRTYLYQDGNLWQLTIDHNIETFLKRGLLQPHDIGPGIKDSALVRSVGLMNRLECDLYEVPIMPGQILITCSDGLFGMVSDERILEIIMDHSENVKNLAQELVDEANRKGGRDNITVVVTQILEK